MTKIVKHKTCLLKKKEEIVGHITSDLCCLKVVRTHEFVYSRIENQETFFA